MANIITTLSLEMSSNWYVSKKLNSIGRVGENTVTKLIIEPTEILDNVTYEIEIADASGSKNVAELTIDGTELYLILTANMLTVSGIMKMQVRGLFTDGSIKKSNIFELKVNRSISATEHYEEYAVTIFDQLVQDCRDIIEGAESYAVRAETAAVNAEAYEQSASASAEAASTAANNASTSATTATTAAETATAASTSAHTSAETATTAAASASASAATATTASENAQTAASTATTASTTAVNASTTATTAATSAENSATSATTAANNASASATAASASASNAATSETNAHTSEVNASTSETNASASATEAAETAESIAASVSQINENTYRINDLEAIIGGYTLTDLPTGAIVSITNGTALLMPSLKVGIEPVQDLHGYDHPWAGGAGKNLFDIDSAAIVTGKYAGLSFVKQNDGFVKISGVYTGTDSVFSIRLFTEQSVPRIQDAYVANFTTEPNIRNVRWTDTSGGIAVDFQNLVNGQKYTIYVRPLIYTGTAPTTWTPYSNICPISGCGWTEANITRSGKNLYKGYDVMPNGYRGLYFAAQDGKLNVQGTYNDSLPDCSFPIFSNSTSPGFSNYQNYIDLTANNTKPIKAGNYTLTVKSTRQTIVGLYVANELGYCIKNGINLDKFDYYKELDTSTNHIQTFELSRGGYLGIFIRFVYLNKNDVIDETIEIQLAELGSTATTYEPYTGQTYNIQFRDGDNPLTVYGGTLDVTTGELTVTDAHIASYNSETLPSTWISDRDVYAEGTTPTTGAEVVYKLANSVTYHLTPTQIRTLVGNNNIWADTGDIISGKYYKSLT